MSAATLHLCQRCGACCAAFRVAFHWSETEPSRTDAVPEALTQPLDPHRLAMRGTDARAPHCAALVGAIGADVHCSIYRQRPSPCRELQAAWEHGEASPQCDRARERHGLPPLSPRDWTDPS